MNGRALSAIFMLLVLLAAGLVSTPALSGEHPWDSDVTAEDKPVVTEDGWDTRAGDSTQLAEESDDVDHDDGATSSDPDASFSSLMLGLLNAVSIGI